MRAAAALVIFCSSAASCQRTRPLEVGAAPGDLAIAAVVGADGEVSSATLIDPSAEDPPVLAVNGADQVITWVIASDALIDSTGAPLGPEMRAGLRLQVGPPENGACGRCLVPAAVPPQVVFPGDSCTIPRFAKSSRDDAIAAAARLSIRLEWPGPCPCSAHQPARTSRVDLAPIAPMEDPWPAEEIAQTPSGDVGLFSEHFAARIGVSGRRVMRTRTSSRAWCDDGQPGLPFEGPLLSSIGLPDGRFLVASVDPRFPDRVRFHTFDAELAYEAIDLSSTQIVAHHMMLDRDDPGRVFVFGESLVNDAAVFHCEVTDRRTGCELLTDPTFLGPDGEVLAAARLPDGGLAILGDEGGLAFGASQGGAWTFREHAVGRVVTSMGAREPRLLHFLTAHGRKVILCAVALDDVKSVLVLEATVTATGAVFGGEAPAWHVAYEGPGYRCAAASEIPGRPGLLRIALAAPRAIDFDASARLIAEHEHLDRLYQRPTTMPRTLVPGWILAVDGAQSVLRHRSRTATETPSLVYGPPGFEGLLHSALALREDEVWSFGNTNQARRIHTSGVAPSIESVRLSAPWAEGDHATAAAYEPARDAFVVAGYGRTREAWVRRVSTGGRVEELPADDVAAALGSDDRRVLDLARAGPDLFVIAAEGGALARLQGDAIEAVAITWDDPFTTEVERRPEAAACDLRRPTDRQALLQSDDLFRSVDASHGVAWAAGCGELLLRVIAAGERPRAERVSLARPVQTVWSPGRSDPPNLGAVRVFCPDDVLFGAGGTNQLDIEQGRVWQVISAESEEGRLFDHRDFEDVLIREYPPNKSAQLGAVGLKSGAPMEIIGAGGSVSIVYNGGRDVPSTFYRYFSDTRFRAYDLALAAVKTPAGDVVIGGQYGRLTFGRTCP